MSDKIHHLSPNLTLVANKPTETPDSPVRYEHTRDIAPTELHIYRRHLKLSIAETAKYIAKCSNLQWSAYEYGYDPVPEEILARFSRAADEYKRMVALMKMHPKHPLPQFFELAAFRAVFPNSTIMGWRVYLAVISELCVSDGWQVDFEGDQLPEDSPIRKMMMEL